MATDAGQTVPAVIQDLLENGHQYSLIQAYRLLNAFGGPKAHIKMRPSLKMDSARSVIERVEQLDPLHFCIELNIFSLYGRNGILPAYITEMLLQDEQEEHGQSRQFLDLLNQRVYELLLDGRQRTSVISEDQDFQSSALFQRLNALAGLDGNKVTFNTPDKPHRLRYFKLLSSPFRSAEGLATLVSDVMEKVPVEIRQCSNRTVRLPKEVQMALGQSRAAIGEGALLGHQLQESNGTFELQIGPMAYSRFDQLLQDVDQWDQLRQLVRLYLTQPLRCELIFLLNCADFSSCKTGLNNWGQLGRNAWLLQPDLMSVDGHSYQLEARIALD